MLGPQLYLASSSPRRQELLRQIGIRFELLPVDVQECFAADEDPDACVRRLALAKAQAGWRSPARRRQLPVLGADTVVRLDGELLGKPADREAARDMLQRLSGRTHSVYTGVAVCGDADHRVVVQRSRVSFRQVSRREVDAYWLSGEPRDKAGGYGIQGRGALFVRSLTGSYSGVMGLPLCETAELLAGFDVDPWTAPGPVRCRDG
jgi:septum formation protein